MTGRHDICGEIRIYGHSAHVTDVHGAEVFSFDKICSIM